MVAGRLVWRFFSNSLSKHVMINGVRATGLELFRLSLVGFFEGGAGMTMDNVRQGRMIA